MGPGNLAYQIGLGLHSIWLFHQSVLILKVMHPSSPRFRLLSSALVIALLFGARLSAAAPSFDLKDVTYSVEPVAGYELQHKSEPAPHAKLALIYGARVIAGYKIVALEGEYTRGSSDEDFADQSLRLEELTEKLKVGLRTAYDVASILKLSLRGGGEMSQHHTKSTSAGILTESDSPSKLAPYLGGGLACALGSKVSLTAEGTVTFRDLNDLGQSEYQGTFGLRLSL